MCVGTHVAAEFELQDIKFIRVPAAQADEVKLDGTHARIDWASTIKN